MKKLSVLFVSTLIAASLAQGEVLFTEGFDYGDGALTTVGAENWATHSGTAGQIMVSGGSIELMDTQSEDVNRQFGTIDAGSVYASFEVSVTAAAPAAGGDYEYFAHFGPAEGFTFNTRVDVVEAASGGDYTFGLSDSSTAEVFWSSDLTFGVTYTVVISYDVATGLSTIWVDPTSEESTSVTTITSAGDPSVAGFYLRQSGSSVDETITIDNIVVGTTFDDVVGGSAPTWAGYPIVDGYVDTTPWMNFLYVELEPYIWVVDLNNWAYIEEEGVTQDGGWAYIFNPAP